MEHEQQNELPFSENNVVIGILSISDVVKAIMEMQKTIQHKLLLHNNF
jgi:hypothetical protein